jgi:hypothetical protein
MVACLRFLRFVLHFYPDLDDALRELGLFQIVLTLFENIWPSGLGLASQSIICALFNVIAQFLYIQSPDLNAPLSQLYSWIAMVWQPASISVLNLSSLELLIQLIGSDGRAFLDASKMYNFGSGLVRIIRMTDEMASVAALQAIEMIVSSDFHYFDGLELIEPLHNILVCTVCPELTQISAVEVLAALADEPEAHELITDMIPLIFNQLYDRAFSVKSSCAKFLAILVQMSGRSLRLDIVAKFPDIIDLLCEYADESFDFAWRVLAALTSVLAHTENPAWGAELVDEIMSQIPEDNIEALLQSDDLKTASNARAFIACCSRLSSENQD